MLLSYIALEHDQPSYIRSNGCLLQLRVRLGALSRALTRRSNEAAASHGAHRIALATLALQAALEQAHYPTSISIKQLSVHLSWSSKSYGELTPQGMPATTAVPHAPVQLLCAVPPFEMTVAAERELDVVMTWAGGSSAGPPVPGAAGGSGSRWAGG